MKTVDEEHVVVQNNKKITTLLLVLGIAVLVVGVLDLVIQGYVAFGISPCRNTIAQQPITGQSVQNITHIFSAVVNKIDDISQQQLNTLDQIWSQSGAIKNLQKELNSFSTDTQDIQQLINVTQNNTQAINDIVVSLSHIRNTTTSNTGAINNILLLIEKILQLQNGSSISPIPTSCQEIKNKQPNSASGVYLLITPSGDTNYVYCHMGELCGTEGGWARLAYLDMSDSTQNCPTGFRLYESNEVRACGRANSGHGGSCQSVQFPSNGINYSQVCGRVVGYQYASPDAVYSGSSAHNNMNSYYVDGVSITHGSPRQHIWTLMAGFSDTSFYDGVGYTNCPCSQGSLQSSTLQSFIGNDYFCESGNPSTHGTWQSILYTQDPLWDGKGCGSLEGNCCSAPGLPWFNKILNSTTTDYIELRVCGDQGISDEDVPVSFYELYIK